MHARYADKDESQIPDPLLNEPELLPGLNLYFDAFWELCPDRQLGMSVGPIPYTSIRQYCIDWNLNEELTFNMKKLVRKLDLVYLEWQEKKAKATAKIKGKGK